MTSDEHTRELRDRIIRLEADHTNLKDSHNVTKVEFAAFKKEMLEKFDELSHEIGDIKLTLAKYLGGFTVVLFVSQLALKFFFNV